MNSIVKDIDDTSKLLEERFNNLNKTFSSTKKNLISHCEDLVAKLKKTNDTYIKSFSKTINKIFVGKNKNLIFLISMPNNISNNDIRAFYSNLKEYVDAFLEVKKSKSEFSSFCDCFTSTEEDNGKIKECLDTDKQIKYSTIADYLKSLDEDNSDKIEIKSDKDVKILIGNKSINTSNLKITKKGDNFIVQEKESNPSDSSKNDLYSLLCTYAFILELHSKEIELKKKIKKDITDDLENIHTQLVSLQKQYKDFEKSTSQKYEKFSNKTERVEEDIIEKIEVYLGITEIEGGVGKAKEPFELETLKKFDKNITNSDLQKYALTKSGKVKDIVSFIHNVLKDIKGLNDLYKGYILVDSQWSYNSEDLKKNGGDGFAEAVMTDDINYGVSTKEKSSDTKLTLKLKNTENKPELLIQHSEYPLFIGTEEKTINITDGVSCFKLYENLLNNNDNKTGINFDKFKNFIVEYKNVNFESGKLSGNNTVTYELYKGFKNKVYQMLQKQNITDLELKDYYDLLLKYNWSSDDEEMKKIAKEVIE